jgi:hypothetical protein
MFKQALISSMLFREPGTSKMPDEVFFPEILTLKTVAFSGELMLRENPNKLNRMC